MIKKKKLGKGLDALIKEAEENGEEVVVGRFFDKPRLDGED